jgi:hypothetical protein
MVIKACRCNPVYDLPSKWSLLMRLLTNPSGFDRGGEHLEARIGW